MRCWRRLLRVRWPARRSYQSILKEISPGCSLEGLMLKLKLQYFGHLMQRVDSLEKILILGGIGGRRRRGRQRMRRLWLHCLDGHEFEWTPGVGDRQGGMACCNSWGCKESDMTEQLNWTELKIWFTIQIGKYVTKGLFLPSSSILHCTVTHSLCNAGHVRTLPVDT